MTHIILHLANSDSETAHPDENQNYSMNSKSKILPSSTLFLKGLLSFIQYIPSNFGGYYSQILANILTQCFL
jgi:hypothetical protein